MYRTSTRKFFIFITIALIISASAVTAQESPADSAKSEKKFGISAALQTAQLDLSFPIWPGSSIVIIPSISVVSVSNVATDFGFGLGLRYNLKNTTEAVPYIGARVAVLMLLPSSGDSFTDIVFGPFAGGEYFFSDHFSVSIEAQINVALSAEFSNRFGNPNGTNFNTATVAFATFYF